MNSTPDLPKAPVLRTLDEAFSKWAAVTSLVFVRVPPTSRDADITIRFVEAGDHGDEKPFRKGITEQLVGHTFPPWNNTGRSGDIHFNDDKYFSLPGYARAAYDFLWIAMHEIGHSLGLAHTGDPFSVMYTTYTAYFYNRKRDLSADDIRGIQALYGPPLPSGIPNECAVTSLSAMVMTADGTIYAFAGAFFWVLSERGPISTALRISKFWVGMESDIGAAFTRASDGMTFLLKDNRFWMFHNRVKYNGPLPITDPELNIPLNLTGIDAALESTNNKTVLLFKGTNYWRYRTDRQEIVSNRPKRIGRGVLEGPDAALFWRGKGRFLFNGDSYYRLRGRRLRTKPGYPRSMADYWMACGFINTTSNPVLNP